VKAERRVVAEREQRQAASTLGVYGERPPGPFGPVPVSEIAIFVGGLATLIGLASGEAPALATGIIVCTLGVVEVTAREHLSGYRSHATLLAAVPAVGIGVAMIALFGSSLRRGALLAVVVPVFGALFWVLRKRFRTARQARVIKPPAP
jgi:energy-converting hydrogenase Eha subunit A